jgi:alpha-tubulin suppressor-like RCC1 family protein
MPLGSSIGVLRNKKAKLITDDKFKVKKVVTTYSNTFILYADGLLYGMGSNASLQVCASGLTRATKNSLDGYYINTLSTYKTALPYNNYNANTTFNNALVYKLMKTNISDVLDFDSSVTSTKKPFFASCLAVKNDGTLWGWGYNKKNALGLSNTYTEIQNLRFVTEGSDTNWATPVDTYRRSTSALLTPIISAIVDKPTKIGNLNNWKSVVTNTLEDGYKHILLNNAGEIYTLGKSLCAPIKLSTRSDWKYISYDYGIDNYDKLYRLKSITITPLLNISANSVAIAGPFKDTLICNINLSTFKNNFYDFSYYTTPYRFLSSGSVSLIESEIQTNYKSNVSRDTPSIVAFGANSDTYDNNNKEFNCLIVGTDGKLSGFGTNIHYQLTNKPTRSLGNSYGVDFQEITSFSSPITGVKMVDNSVYATTKNANLYTWGLIDDRIGVGKRGVTGDKYELSPKLVAVNVKTVIPIPAARMSYLIGYNNKLSACGHLAWGPLSSVQFDDNYNDTIAKQVSGYNTGGLYRSVKLLEAQNISNIYGHYYNYYALTTTGKVWLWGKNKNGYAGLPLVPAVTRQVFRIGNCFGPKAIAVASNGDVFYVNNSGTLRRVTQDTVNNDSIGGSGLIDISIGSQAGEEYVYGIRTGSSIQINRYRASNGTASTLNRTWNNPNAITVVNNDSAFLSYGSFLHWEKLDNSNSSGNYLVNGSGGGNATIGVANDQDGRGYETFNPVCNTGTRGGWGFNNAVTPNIRVKSLATNGATIYGFTGRKVKSVDTTSTCKNITEILDIGITIDGAIAVGGGFTWIADTTNHVIRRNGAVWAGSSGTSGFADGTGAAARFNRPSSIKIFDGFLYVADTNNHRIRKVSMTNAAVTTWFGTGVASDTLSITETIIDVPEYYPTKLHPFEMPTLAGVKELFTCGYSYNSVFALGNNNKLSAWGYNADGRLGLGHNNLQATPFELSANNIKNVVFCYETPLQKSAPAGTDPYEFYHKTVSTFILDNAGGLSSCGSNTFGQLGINSTTSSNKFNKITIAPVQEIYAFDYGRVFALGTNNKLSAWGFNRDGLLGLGLSGSNQLQPKEIRFPNPNITITKVYPHKNKIDMPICNNCTYDGINRTGAYILSGGDSEFVMFARTSNDELYTWGSNNFGQLGLGIYNEEEEDIRLITPVISATLVKNISSVTNVHNGTYGSIGFGTTYNEAITSYYQEEPIEVEPYSSWLTVDKHSDIGIKYDGTLWDLIALTAISTDTTHENVFYGQPVKTNVDTNIEINFEKCLGASDLNTLSSFQKKSPVTKIVNYKSEKIKVGSTANFSPGLSVNVITQNYLSTFPNEITKYTIY